MQPEAGKEAHLPDILRTQGQRLVQGRLRAQRIHNTIAFVVQFLAKDGLLAKNGLLAKKGLLAKNGLLAQEDLFQTGE